MAVTDNSARSGQSDSDSRRSPRRSPVSMRQLKSGQAFVRNKIAGLIWLVAALCAAVLAIGALLVAFDANENNAVYEWFTDAAERLAGPVHDLFRFEDEAKRVLVNWGVAAIAYLVVGRILQRIVKA